VRPARRRFGDQGGHHLAERSAEEGLQILLQSGALGDSRRSGRGVDVAQAILLVFQAAFLFEPGEHDADGGIAGRLRQAGADFFRGCAIAEGEDGVHDFAFAAGEDFRIRFGH
jgi:hypothetical protein